MQEDEPDYSTQEPPITCPNCGAVVREETPPVDVLTTCGDCEHRFWIQPLTLFDDPADEIPPGFLAIACLVGGGTSTIVGNLSGNTAISSVRQAQAASRAFGAQAVQERGVIQSQGGGAGGSVQDINISAGRQQERQLRSVVDRGGR